MKIIATNNPRIYCEIEMIFDDWYMAYFCHNDICMDIGRFETEEEAALASIKTIYKNGLAIA